MRVDYRPIVPPQWFYVEANAKFCGMPVAGHSPPLALSTADVSPSDISPVG